MTVLCVDKGMVYFKSIASCLTKQKLVYSYVACKRKVERFVFNIQTVLLSTIVCNGTVGRSLEIFFVTTCQANQYICQLLPLTLCQLLPLTLWLLVNNNNNNNNISTCQQQQQHLLHAQLLLTLYQS